MSKSKALAGVFGAVAILFAITGCGSDAPTSYAELSAEQQARVDKACHAGTDYPSRFPAEFAHCVDSMTRTVSK